MENVSSVVTSLLDAATLGVVTGVNGLTRSVSIDASPLTVLQDMPLLLTLSGGALALAFAAVLRVRQHGRMRPVAVAASAVPGAGTGPLRATLPATEPMDELAGLIRAQQAQIQSLQELVRAQSSALLLQGKRVLALEDGLTLVDTRQQRGQDATQDIALGSDHAVACEQAIRLARQGLSRDVLASRCGISPAEAELIALLHTPALSA